MSHDERLEESLDRYTLRRVQVGAEAADHSEVSNIARAFYEDDRFSRAFQNEVTAEMRRWQLHDLFKRVDAEQKLSTKKKKQKEEIDVLGEVTNSTKVLETQKRSEIVTRTEIVPMLPCKGYELPRGHLFIGGRGDDVEVFHPMEEDQQIEALLDKAQLAEERLLEEQHAKLILRERLEKEQMKRHTILRPQKAKKLRGFEKEAEGELQEMEIKFPNCTVG